MDGTLPWRVSFSSTLKGIYVMRYFLFSGGTAIAGALVQRASGEPRPLAGLAVGLAAGLFLFRGQLRPLSYPSLALGRESLFLVQKKQAVILPWNQISEVKQSPQQVSLVLAEPMKAPDGTV